MGLRPAVHAKLDLLSILNAADYAEQRELDVLVRTGGLRATLAWRDDRYEERLSDPARRLS